MGLGPVGVGSGQDILKLSRVGLGYPCPDRNPTRPNPTREVNGSSWFLTPTRGSGQGVPCPTSNPTRPNPTREVGSGP